MGNEAIYQDIIAAFQNKVWTTIDLAICELREDDFSDLIQVSKKKALQEVNAHNHTNI